MLDIAPPNKSPKEAEIILLADEGYNYREIASTLNISREMASLWRERWLTSSEKEINSELVTSVGQIIGRSLDRGCPTIREIASRLGMSSRTLQRYLRSRNVTFNQLVDETRHQLSLTYLKEPKLSITKVALLLGYSELSAFNHAFRRWTRLSPREYRRQDSE